MELMTMQRRLNTATAVVAVFSVCCETPAEPVSGLTPAEPVPGFQYVASRACSNVLAYTWSEGLTEYLVVSADIMRLEMTLGTTRTFDVATVSDHLSIRVDMYAERAVDLYCSDVKMNQELDAWRAISGTVTIALPISQGNDPSVLYSNYRVVITVADLMLQGPRRQRVSVAGPITLTGQGGGNPFG